MLTIKQVEFIDQKKLAKAALDKNFKTFVIHIAALEALLGIILIYLDKKAQIASLLTKKLAIPQEYSDFANIFLEKRP